MKQITLLNDRLRLLIGYSHVPGHQAFHPFHFGPRPFPFGHPQDPLGFKLSGKCPSVPRIEPTAPHTPRLPGVRGVSHLRFRTMYPRVVG